MHAFVFAFLSDDPRSETNKRYCGDDKRAVLRGHPKAVRANNVCLIERVIARLPRLGRGVLSPPTWSCCTTDPRRKFSSSSLSTTPSCPATSRPPSSVSQLRPSQAAHRVGPNGCWSCEVPPTAKPWCWCLFLAGVGTASLESSADSLERLVLALSLFSNVSKEETLVTT